MRMVVGIMWMPKLHNLFEGTLQKLAGMIPAHVEVIKNTKNAAANDLLATCSTVKT